MTQSKIVRRRFIQGLSGVAAAPLFPAFGSTLATQPSLPLRAIGRPFPDNVELPDTVPTRKNTDSVGIALVGLGLYALGKMAPALTQSKHCHLAAVVSGNPGKAKQVAKAYGLPNDAIYSYANFEDIAKDERIDAVYIVLPSGLHAEWTEKAFAAGKHVLCEKPMALSASECMRMISAGQKAKRKLMIGYRCHFEPNNLTAMQLMRDNVVGDIQMIRTDQHYHIGNATPADSWRVNAALAGGGALDDYGIYGLQAAIYLSREMPVSVSAATSTPAGRATFSEIVNLVASRFTFPSGAVAQLSTSYNAHWHDRVEVRGTDGIMLMDPATAYGGHKIQLRQTKEDRVIMENGANQFAAMLDHFGDCLLNDKPVLTDGPMGLRDVRLIEAVYAAAKSKTEIQLRPDGTMKA